MTARLWRDNRGKLVLTRCEAARVAGGSLRDVRRARSAGPGAMRPSWRGTRTATEDVDSQGRPADQLRLCDIFSQPLRLAEFLNLGESTANRGATQLGTLVSRNLRPPLKVPMG